MAYESITTTVVGKRKIRVWRQEDGDPPDNVNFPKSSAMIRMVCASYQGLTDADVTPKAIVDDLVNGLQGITRVEIVNVDRDDPENFGNGFLYSAS